VTAGLSAALKKSKWRSGSAAKRLAASGAGKSVMLKRKAAKAARMAAINKSIKAA
jgi:hypothetical protein